LKELIYKHLELTESARAKEILGEWSKFEPLFWKVSPHPPIQPPPITKTGATVPPAAPPEGAAGDGVLAPPSNGDPAKA